MPDYHRSGGKGKDKSAGNKKRGRPRKTQNTGINVDESTKKIFRVALEKYYLTTMENSLSDAYKMMIREFYAKDFYYENGIPKLVLEDEDKLPTLTQFKYWYQKEYDVQHTTVARKGRVKFEKDYRAVLGTSNQETYGPGSRFQIDATVADVFLVSRYNSEWIIGRPVVYLVIDVFSRMITGMYVGLEGPSWMGAMMAIANTARDKQEFCKEYEIDIPKSLWPSEHLPEVLLADRGELEGYNPERLISAFNLHIENAAPYRADWKGIIEKQFDIIQKRTKPFLPGYINKDYRERGARDYRLDAKLTIYQFTQLMIKQVISYNTKHYLNNYIRDEEMIQDDVTPIPIELWNWGIENRSGKLRYYPEELVKLHLLPTGQATVTYKGIKFKNMYFSSERAIKESWFPLARQKGSWKLKVSYDPRNMNEIYVHLDQGEYETAQLLKHQERYLDHTLDEINYLHEIEKQKKQESEYGQLQKDIDLMTEIEEIVKDAEKSSKQNKKTVSKSNKEKTDNIRQHRKREKEIQKKEETFVQDKKTSQSDSNVVSFKQNTDQENYERPTIKEFLRKKNKR
ncbi:MAG: DDE-type integrase/transposase/recombinase [Bacillaceae bacterium]|nr:DDE-type integrase/transposase/recombinase [Bacillaceae bacterium]